MLKESDILNKLVVDEKEVTQELDKLVQEASKIFRIEKPAGRVIFQDFGALNDKQRILVLLLGKYFAQKLELINDSWLGISEISKEIGRPMTALSGKIRELVKMGYVEYLPKPQNKYRIAYLRIKEIVDNLLVAKSQKNGR